MGNSYPFVHVHSERFQVDHTDGIGTKGVFHWTWSTFAEAVQDALAMNLNDLLTVRARPVKLQNHLTLPSDDHQAILQIITELCKECKKRQILVTGGETSVHDNYKGMDLSLTVTGICECPLPNEFIEGDLLVGLPSNGVHSNGFTHIRKFFPELSRDFTTPTRIYWDDVYPLVTGDYMSDVHGMVHIAGGGFTRLLKHARAYKVKLGKWPLQPIFEKIWKTATTETMYKTFNCGIGMVLSVVPGKAEELATLLGGYVIGEVSRDQEGGRLEIDSIFDRKTIIW